MKTFKPLVLMVLIMIPLGLTAQSIVGSWLTEITDKDGNPTDMKMEMFKNGTYIVDIGDDDSIETRGTYTAQNGKLTFRNNKDSDCTGEGVYNYKIEDETLTLTRITDECEGRGGPEGVVTFESDD